MLYMKYSKISLKFGPTYFGQSRSFIYTTEVSHYNVLANNNNNNNNNNIAC